jgi:ABC-2 type transport system ATP-binding protein
MSSPEETEKIAPETPDASAPKKKKRKPAEAAVRLMGATKRFGNKIAVDDLTLSIPDGAVYGLIGPNGAGKTTTFSMLAGYLKPTSGSVEVLGFPPTNVDELRSRVGVLPQDAILPASDRVGEFLIHMARLQEVADAEAAAREVLREVDGLEWWGVGCGSLSHGMAKRVALAQALLGDPEVVFLDEPTGGLDPKVAYEVRQLIKARRKRCTLVVSSHNLQELEEICDRAAILDHGHLIAHGTMAELTASSSEIRVELARGPVPEEAVRAVEGVKAASWDKGSRELCITIDRQVADAEEMIRRVTYVLYQHQARISGISKGRGLEQRVMELTE